MPTSTSRVIWRNWHETVIQPVIQYENLRNVSEAQSTVGGYNQTARTIQGHIQHALEQETSLRAAGGGWSFAPVAATDGILLGTQRLNYRFALRQEHLIRQYAPGEFPVLLQCGISIADANAYLAGRDQALRTSGASNGQTIAGALGTGTHGAALDIGAVQDYVVAIHLAISPSETIWLERKDYPVLRPEVMELFRARPFLDNDVFDAALVSFGSFGIVLGVVIEPDPLYYLHAWRQPIELTNAVWQTITSFEFQNDMLPGAGGRRPRHLELILNPYGSRETMVTTMYQETARPTGSARPSLDGGFGKGDSALDVIGVITDKWDGSSSLAASLFKAAYKPYANIAGTPGEIFKATSTRGRGASSAMGIPSSRAQEAFELAGDIVRKHAAPAIVAMRFVKATNAVLGFTQFTPVTCVLEVDGAFSSRTRMAQQEVWETLESKSLPYTFHWGKMNNLDDRRVRARYGNDRVTRWLSARNQVLPTPELRRLFANEFTDQLKLSG